MQNRFARSLALLTITALAAGGCGVGLRLGGFGVGVGVGAATSSVVTASSDPTGVRVDRQELRVDIRDNGTYDAVVNVDRTVLSAAGLEFAQRAEVSFQPPTQTARLIEAYVTHPNGTRTNVTEDNVFTRPSTASQDSPGFSGSQTTTVLFPQLTVGARTHVRWGFEDRGTSPLGFNYVYRPAFSLETTQARITITAPELMGLSWDGGGDFDVTSETESGRVSVTATLAGSPARHREPGMVDPSDVLPTFVVSSVESWEDIGSLFFEAAADAVQVTPEIRALAEEVAGNLQGEDAARALHRWVCENNAYVATHMSAAGAWVPHPAGEVLRNGYGDCKDKWALLASLLQARGLDCEAVLIDRDRAYETLALPSPLQFDHCIAYLPDFDTYVDPTSQFHDYGSLDVALRGKFVVRAGRVGIVGQTPAGRTEDNRYHVAHEVKLLSDGTLSGTSSMAAQGHISGIVRSLLAGGNAVTRAESVLVKTPEGGTGAATASDPTDLAQPLTVSADWRSLRAVNMGEQAFLTTPVGFDYASPARLQGFFFQDERQYPAVLGAGELAWDYVIALPKGYRVERLPEGASIENAAGKYTSSYGATESGEIRIARRLQIARDYHPATEYSGVHNLLGTFLRDARDVIVLRKGDAN